MDMDDWKTLANQIHDNYYKYRGFVIIHGTDTMAYTASALAFMLENLSKPVVLTGSMLPFVSVQSDARRNLVLSLTIAAKAHISEVVIVINDLILRGCRTTKFDCNSIRPFDSPNLPPLCKIGVDFRFNNDLLLNPPRRTFTISTRLRSDIVVVWVFPGFDLSVLELLLTGDKKPVGLVFLLFGSGNLPSHKGRFVEILQKGIDEGVNICVITQCTRGSVDLLAYEGGTRLYALGVINGRDLTAEAAVAKMAYLMGKGLRGTVLKQV
eukprot:GHVL01035360.1.p1 GENE.GHVL01035360.1~~GHVL01035360.1.p1  ORF type:complete len:267 (-),score=18.59 GHVL01035360.1:49-849(-)